MVNIAKGRRQKAEGRRQKAGGKISLCKDVACNVSTPSSLINVICGYSKRHDIRW
ncbi:MAG: hypothetical protein F6K39_27760 [Okeania sp. SIO3B3]|nr:hypothetical protein [Okeania sp. SIO3B3]